MPTQIDARVLLDFEERWPRDTPAKEEAIRTELGVTPARYFQLLNRAVDTREALEERPLLVHALRRRRDAARRRRVA